MFVRKKKNRSGSISVVVIDKSDGKFKEIKRFGVATSEIDVEILCNKANDWILRHVDQQTINFNLPDKQEGELKETKNVLSRIDKILLNSPYIILEDIYNQIGFNKIGDDILRHLVISRICQPMSKLATVTYLKSYYNEDVELHNIYRYMDKLHNTQQDLIQSISVAHTQKILGGKIGLMFYDVTTLYFESSVQDELRMPGFSKDGKTSESQIVLGLLVSANGYPLSYSVFRGDQFEGRTMLPIVDDFIQRFSLSDFIIVADSGLMSSKNIKLLQDAGYKYILGARIRSESKSVKEWVLSQEKRDNKCHQYKKGDTERLILTYSSKRAKKDEYNRNKGIVRLHKAYDKGVLTKEHINKRGYNKFLEINKDVKVSISQTKILEDSQWDGLKGYITNTDNKVLTAREVVDHYNGLWVVEKAFRISKSTLEMRPIFHFSEKRILAHISICFVAYKVYKELERIIDIMNIGISVDKVIAIAKTITTIYIKQPYNESVHVETLFLTDEQIKIKTLFNMKVD